MEDKENLIFTTYSAVLFVGIMCCAVEPQQHMIPNS
jgi:hypothetical protein